MTIILADKARWNQLGKLIEFFHYTPDSTRNHNNSIGFELHVEPDDLAVENFPEQLKEITHCLAPWNNDQIFLAVHDVLANDPIHQNRDLARKSIIRIKEGIEYSAKIAESLNLSHIVFNLHCFISLNGAEELINRRR